MSDIERGKVEDSADIAVLVVGGIRELRVAKRRSSLTERY